MKRINSEKIFNELKRVTLRFPLTIIFILLLAGWKQYSDGMIWLIEPTFLLFITGIIFSATSQLFYERFYKKRPQMRWILYGVVIAFVSLYYLYLTTSYSVIDKYWQFYSIPGIRTMILYFVAIILFIWAPTIKTKIKFSDSFLVTFKAYFTTVFFSIILFLGVFSIIMLFELLFFSLNIDWFSYSTTLIFYLFAPILFFTFIPNYDLLESENEAKEQTINMPKFLHHLISYILIPIMVVFTGIIVVYILTNLTNDFFSENILEGLLLSYTINGWVLLILTDSIENKMAEWFKKIFPTALIFVTAFQMLSTFLQIQEVGVTHGRYIILLFGVGSITSGIWYLLKKHRLQILPIVAIVGGIIALVPPLDALTVSVNQQRDRINEVLNKYDMMVDSRNVTPNPNVQVKDQEVIQESLNYLSDINALNQLEWLPEEYYYREREYLGFVTDEDPFGQGGNYREEINQTDVHLDEKYPNIPIDGFEQLFDLSLGSNHNDFFEIIELKGEEHAVEIYLDEEFIIEIDADSLENPLEFDFSYVLEDLTGETNLSLSREELTFTEEVDGYQVQIIIDYLDISGDYMQMDLYLLL